jgi:hypothetical protein
MNATLRNRRFPMVVLLLLCAAPPCADAQQFVCWPIVRGDTASGLARQLTGNAAAAYSDAFQIRDPSRRMFVPKSHYRRLSTDWEACVARGPVMSLALADEPAPIRSYPLADTPVVSLAAASQRDITFAVKTGAVLLLMLLMFAAVADHMAARRIPPVMQRAGEEFISAFARPLIDPSSSDPPIAVRMRFVRHAQQLEISIAPGEGRRYPNLVDHKRNVEYDVHRVIHLLGTRVVVSDRLRAVGKWVVVPIRLANSKQAGAK